LVHGEKSILISGFVDRSPQWRILISETVID